MKIQNKLTISFSITVSLILILLGIVIYYFSARYQRNEFYNRLLERVGVTEKMFLESENLPAPAYELVKEQFLHKLTGETEEVIEVALLEPETEKYPPVFIRNLVENGEAYFEKDSLQMVGKIFHLANSDFAVILTGVDEIGIQMLGHLQTILVLAIAGCILFVSLVGYYTSGKALHPISKKIQKANSISAQNIHERLTVYNPDDEIGELATAFNNLLDRVASAFDAQRSFIDNASHEMRNPLTSIMGEAELALEKERTSAEYVESIKAIAAQADRLGSMVNNLLELASISYRDLSFNPEPVRIKDLLTESRNKLDFTSPENKIQLNLPKGEGPTVQGSSHLLQIAFTNLLDNASKFSNHQEVDVDFRVVNDEKTIVSIRDRGIGIPAADLLKITQPFHRAANVRGIKGTGIGMSLSNKIIEIHQGRIDIRSKLHEGTEVMVTLPLFN